MKLNIQAPDKARLALFAIFSLAITAALSVCAASSGTLLVVAGSGVVVFIVSAVLNYFGQDRIIRLVQFVAVFVILVVQNLVGFPELPINSKIPLAACTLIASFIVAMAWPTRTIAERSELDHAARM